MAYQVTIKEVTREQVIWREWKVIGTKKDNDGKEEPEYGYVNESKTEDVEREIYSQRVEKLDIVDVINAVNKTAPAPWSAQALYRGKPIKRGTIIKESK